MSRAAGVSIFAVAFIVWAALMWGVYQKDATGRGLPAEKGLTYDEAVERCGWIAAAENVECFVIPDGELWQALPGQ